MRFVGILGLAAALGLAWLVSRDRRNISWRLIALGVALQALLAVLLLRVGAVKTVFAYLAEGFRWFLGFGDEGAKYLFGALASGQAPVIAEGRPLGLVDLGAIVILKILPTIIFVSSAMSVLYHLGIVQRVVSAFAWVVTRTLRVSGAEALAATANIFMGMTEAPLVVRPYLQGMTPSEFLVIMVGGFATISGSMMAVYGGMGIGFDHLLAASVLNAPAAIYLAKLYFPETARPATLGEIKVRFERDTVNVVDAAASGAATGLALALNVGAMLLAFSAGLKLIDAVLAWVGAWVMPEAQVLTLGVVLGWVFAPFAWLLGIPAGEVLAVGELLGKKIALNEYFAYSELPGAGLSPRSTAIATFALCGFANFGSVAIQLGGIGGLAPSRRAELARFGIPAMLLGALASFSSAALAGLLIE
jgi:CNT family concentrative nucleoside transporter